MELKRILAIDIGGSGSRALLIDEGKELAAIQDDAANLLTCGPATLGRVVARLLAAMPEVEAIALAVAGLRTEADGDSAAAALRAAGIDIPFIVFPDIRAALRAGGLDYGACLLAGTGSSALAVGRNGIEARAGGWGRVFGDEGSGFWLGRELIRLAARAHDEGDETGAGLLDVVLRATGTADVHALRRLPREDRSVERIAGLAPILAGLRAAGNGAADEIYRQGIGELARLVETVSRRAGLGAGDRLVVAGGLVKAFPDLPDLVAAASEVSLVATTLDRDPAWGAYWLALERGAWRPAPSGRSAPPRLDSQHPALPEATISELVNEDTRDIDRIPTLEILRRMNVQDASVPGAVAQRLPEIAALADEVVRRLRSGGRLIYVGAGTSGRLAMLDAVECVPTFGIEPGVVTALLAGGTEALTSAVEGAEDDADAGRRAAEDAGISRADAVVGISASGSAAFVHGALAACANAGALTALITCSSATAANNSTHMAIAVPVGPEVIAGSTRLKAGTAQKLILNMLSTSVMVRLGRTSGNRMVGVRPTNAKLRRRAIRLVSEMASCDDRAALSALREANWSVAQAVLSLHLGDADEARNLLARSGSDLSAALRALNERHNG